MKEWWNNCCESYGPAIVGGLFLCIADLVQNDRQGQIMKVGGVLKRTLVPNSDIEGWLGLLAVLLLSAALCWVFRPATRGDAFAKGASVFAILAALVPANVRPGASLTSPDNSGKPPASALSLLWLPVSRAHAQSVIPMNPVAKARIAVGGSGGLEQDVAGRIQSSGLSVWLIDPESGQEVAFERVKIDHFVISKPPKRYILEVELDGFRRMRTELDLKGDPQSYDLKLTERGGILSSVQRLLPAARPDLVLNKGETFKLQGAEASRRGDFPVALAAYDEALKLQANDKETLNYKGYALYRLGKFEEAAKVLSVARQLDPSFFLVRLNLAKASCRLGRTAEASTAIFGQPGLTKQELQVAHAEGEFTRDCKNLAKQDVSQAPVVPRKR